MGQRNTMASAPAFSRRRCSTSSPRPRAPCLGPSAGRRSTGRWSARTCGRAAPRRGVQRACQVDVLPLRVSGGAGRLAGGFEGDLPDPVFSFQHPPVEVFEDVDRTEGNLQTVLPGERGEQGVAVVVKADHLLRAEGGEFIDKSLGFLLDRARSAEMDVSPGAEIVGAFNDVVLFSGIFLRRPGPFSFGPGQLLLRVDVRIFTTLST